MKVENMRLFSTSEHNSVKSHISPPANFSLSAYRNAGSNVAKSPMSLNLKNLLDEKGVSQTTLAQALGASRGYVSEIVSGKKQPSLEMLERIAAELNVSTGDLFANNRAQGFEEPSVRAFVAKSPSAKRHVAALTRALAPHARHPILHEITQCCPAAMLMKGDLLIADAHPDPTDGDLVVVQVQDTESGEVETDLATWHRGAVIPLYGRPQLPSDKTAVTVMASVLATVRRGSTSQI